MSQLLDQEIRTLREHFWSARDPEGHAFAPLADAYRRKHDLDEAASLVTDGLARLPEFTPGYLVASRIFRARGELGKARAALDRLLELDGENVLALLEWAELSRDTGDHADAISGLRRLLVLDPAHLGARSMLDRLDETVPPTEEREAEAGAGEVPDSTGEAELDPGPLPALEPGLSLDSGDDPSEVLDPSVHGDDDEMFPDLEPEPILDASAELGEPFVETAAGEDATELSTRTMAELFVRQGLVDRAVRIYERLAAADPMNDDLARRLAELREGGSAGDSDEAPAELATEAVPGDEVALELETTLDLELESTEDSDGVEDRSPRTIRDFMDDLLSWRSGAVPVSVLSPEAPDEVAPEGSRLAIRVAGAVPVEDLAPGAPLRTAPAGSPAALRGAPTEPDPEPDRTVSADDPPQPREEDDDMDEFRDWLEGFRT
ncbi:MAG: tetratricopeptide repeat protein [Gemmatimonadota bacterium]